MAGPLLKDGLSADTVVGAAPAAAMTEAFDPAKHTMAEVDEYLDTVPEEKRLTELNRVRFVEAQRDDGARPHLLDHLDNLIGVEKLRREAEHGVDPNELTVEEVKAYVERHRDDRLEDRLTLLQAAETAGKGRSTLLTWLANELTFLQDAVPGDTETTEEPTSDENTEPAGDGAEDDTTTEES